ncbi:hypothetical protein [Roseospira visakhapatnamensis]|uniref:5-bromo-4-chloroindolyl phosphate hydrolysis protein n=1 Tax=Roseospira visakhapatnamensis TaxID=390880 RepID=A0A7W6WAP8_9PROT|nr:hypothetical protein [Roseospira visakhapatnamensis]MBB4266732.1 hypothetical protein [Roseospira visakhapatnamensis]
MPDVITMLTSLTALVGGLSAFRGVFGPIRGKPTRGPLMPRVQKGLSGVSLVVIALAVAAPVGLFGAWLLTLALGALVALARPRWMTRGRDPGRANAALTYVGLMAVMLALGTATGGMPTGAAAADSTVADLTALGSLLLARKWLWFWRKGAPFAHLDDPKAAEAEAAAEDARARADDSLAWWDRIWMRRRSGDASFDGASPRDAGSAGHGPDARADGGAANTREAPEDQTERGSSSRRTRDKAKDPDETLRVPGYDPVLLAEELATFRAHARSIDRVALTWPDHPVSEALIHVSVILNETRRYLQDNPDKYRDLRPILVGHATTAADIASLVQRIKGAGETLDDAEGVARRLFALASLMRETRRKSTQAERDRLKASMAVIDEELNALSAMRDLRERVARESELS